ncbi:hypothetical protein C7B62_05630 [Pleurocapsa sp. CCALA 161]|uniref:hypothetical protein n=1 Tax=Pleurocapsa sp. CCALA 161 TaxID=2107688 RepID=UPI000D04C01B|nr:hypothetical protein [Pleurocapsa sp. CCALA 161]PSB11386.1 hypothetical protein C7B62_05630 [Pleurocapsa sp. CCALA 161]
MNQLQISKERWLYERLKKENPSANPQFSFDATCNWLRAIALLCEINSFEKIQLSEFYKSVQRRTVNRTADTLVFEQAFMSFHNLAGLEAIKINQDYHCNLIQSAIINWYYGIYFAASAMITAGDGSYPQDHASTANAWTQHFVITKKIVYPFNLYLPTLVEKEYKVEVEKLRQGNASSVHESPIDEGSAHSVCISFLKGSADWYREKKQTEILKCTEFQNKGFTNFRKLEARKIRDYRLQKKKVSFLHQAFRFRGKANYRDAIYLSYGEKREQEITNLIEDLYFTLHCFLSMASHYCSKRVERQTWLQFSQDIEKNKLVSTSTILFQV